MKVELIALIIITNISVRQNIDKKYPELMKRIIEINNYEDFETISLNEGDLKGLFKGDSRLFGMYQKDDLQKMTLISVTAFGVEAFDYYFFGGELAYINETFDQFIKKGELATNRTFYGRYYFKDNKLYDSETTGHNRFEDDSLDPEAILIDETKRNAKLLTGKKTNNHK